LALGYVVGGILEFMLEFFTLVSWIADAISFFKSRKHRAERKAAKAAGEPAPKPSRSYIAYVVLTISSLTLTALLVLKWFDLI
jgi:hypothetical protein